MFKIEILLTTLILHEYDTHKVCTLILNVAVKLRGAVNVKTVCVATNMKCQCFKHTVHTWF